MNSNVSFIYPAGHISSKINYINPSFPKPAEASGVFDFISTASALLSLEVSQPNRGLYAILSKGLQGSWSSPEGHNSIM